MEGALMGLMTTMLGPAWVCIRLAPYRCLRECITLDSFKYCSEARSSTRSNSGGFAWNSKSEAVKYSPGVICNWCGSELIWWLNTFSTSSSSTSNKDPSLSRRIFTFPSGRLPASVFSRVAACRKNTGVNLSWYDLDPECKISILSYKSGNMGQLYLF